MVNPGLRERCQFLVQHHGVGRGQRAVVGEIGTDDPQGADACGAGPGRGPDLAGEGGDGSLAGGAGDGHGGGGLRCEETGGHERQAAARIGVGDHEEIGEFRLEVGGVIGQHGAGALGDGIRDETAAVGAAARQGCEEETRAYLTGIRGQAADVDVAVGFPSGRRRDRAE